jgi:hypothetical protein
VAAEERFARDGEVTIAFDITAPREGRCHFQWKMARDGNFFGERSNRRE